MKKLLLCLYLACPVILSAQEWSFDFNLGYGNYQLNGAKQMQDDLLDFMEAFGVETTEYFPGRYIPSFSFGYIARHHHFGVNYSYLTTAGRIHVADYSGDYSANLMLSGYRSGIFYRFYFPEPGKRISFFLQASGGLTVTRLRSERRMVIPPVVETKKIRYKSVGTYVEPSVGIRFSVLPWLHLSTSLGYEFDAGGKIKPVDEDGKSFEYEAGNKVAWNGLRFFAGISFTIQNRF